MLSSCSVFVKTGEGSDTEKERYLSDYSDNWCYKRLSENLKSGYSELYNKIVDTFDADETITIFDSEKDTEKSYKGVKVTLSKPLHSKQEAAQLYNALLWDNPEFFFISNLYSYEGYQSNGKDYYDSFGIVYLSDAKTRREQKAKLFEQVNSILDKLDRSGQFETELALHDRLLEKVTYESGTEGLDRPMEKFPNAFTAYGALVEGRAVCEGYARAMQLLLHKTGIECTLIIGTNQDGASHMWNFVTIDGKNYHLDPTWNDSGDKVRHILFNLTTEEIERTHFISQENIGIDTALSYEAHYFRYLGLYLDTFESSAIAAVVADQIKAGANQIEMQFGQTTYANAQLLIFEKQVLTEKVNTILKEHELSMWSYDNYVQDDNHFVLIIENSGS